MIGCFFLFCIFHSSCGHNNSKYRPIEGDTSEYLPYQKAVQAPMEKVETRYLDDWRLRADYLDGLAWTYAIQSNGAINDQEADRPGNAGDD